MFGTTEKCECPICGAAYECNPKTCQCGFDGLVFLPMFATEEVRRQYDAQRKEEAFRIFKFAKQVYYGETVYEKSELTFFERDGYVDIDEALEHRGLAVVDPDSDAPTVAASGLVALRSNVRALILNTQAAKLEMLEESHVETLLLGQRFQHFCDGGLLQYAPLRYIWADGKNQHFVAEDNVLFDRDKASLQLYARARPGEEYRVPESVKRLEDFSFFEPLYLKRLYLPHGIRILENAFGYHNAYWKRDGVLTKVKPPFEIIYY